MRLVLRLFQVTNRREMKRFCVLLKLFFLFENKRNSIIFALLLNVTWFFLRVEIIERVRLIGLLVIGIILFFFLAGEKG